MKKIIIALFLIINSFANAEVIKELEISGNKRISEETIKVYGEIEINKDYNNFELDNILKNLYSTNFFEDVKINLSNGVLKISLIEYPVINAIQIFGEDAKKVKKAILERMALKEKGPFIRTNLSSDINIIKRAYAGLGFNFVEVETKYEEFSENRVNLIINIIKGAKTKIHQINFIGDKKIRDRRLRDVIASEEHKFWKFISKNVYYSETNVELDKRLLKNYYKSEGYYDVQILSSNAVVSGDKTSLIYNINAGNRYKITKIFTDIDPVFDKQVFLPLEKDFKKNIGKYYSPFAVKKLLESLDILIADADLQFVEHSVNEIIEDGSIQLKINIFEGAKSLVERINIKGNTVTNENVVRSTLTIDEGDPFNNLKLDKSISDLKSKDIFAEVKKNVSEGSSKDLKVIDITVEEKPTGEISAGAGIGTDGGSFAFEVKENNWLGEGINLSTFIDASKETLRGGINVQNPNYKFSGNALNYQISTSKNEKPDSGFSNNVITTGIGTTFEQYRDIYLAPSITLEFDDLEVDDTASKGLKSQAGQFSDLSFKYGITSDKRDRSFMPRSGHIVGFIQSLPMYSDVPVIGNTLDIKKYNSFGPNVVGAFKFFASSVNGLDEDVRLSRRLSIPSSRLRGFSRGKIGPKDGVDYIGGNYATAVNLETALPNLLPESSRIDVGLFLDAGNLWHVDYSNDIDDSNKIRSSIGSNISWISPVGPMSFVFSKNITKADTDRTEGFTFRLGTTF
ncbi:MAG: outer membrane protein assembly factor BamA [Pelagibacteraceae bacterium]